MGIHLIRLRGEPAIFVLPRCMLLKTFSIQEVFQLFVVAFASSPSGVSQLLGDEIEAGPRLGICHDPRLPEKILVGSSHRRERLPRFVPIELQVNHFM